MAIVYLGLGSNLGDRTKNIQEALCMMEAKGIVVTKLSRMIETDPVGGPPQPKFLNGVCRITTDLSPHDLLSELQSIEYKLRRRRNVINGPRTIDLDILLYDNQKIDTPQLNIPHPRMLERDFVLIPLREIEPQFLEKFFS